MQCKNVEKVMLLWNLLKKKKKFYLQVLQDIIK